MANIAFHGLEQALGVVYHNDGHLKSRSPALVRYADDFVVFCHSEAEKWRSASLSRISEWLAGRNLQLSPEKTRLVQLKEGFDFLGFTVRHYRVPSSPSG